MKRDIVSKENEGANVERGIEIKNDGALPQTLLTMAPGEHTSLFFCTKEGTESSFHGIGQTIASHGLFAACTLNGAVIAFTPRRPQSRYGPLESG